MATYRYEGMDSRGGTVHGTLQAESEADATSELRAQGYFVTTITQVSDTGPSRTTLSTASSDTDKPGCTVGMLLIGILSAALYIGLHV